ncbi:MAG: hypothetical protein AAGK32_01015 [Actinomycetota bacterium]
MIVLAMVVAVVVAVRRNQRRLRALDAATVELTFDDTGVRRGLADGRTETVTWSDLREVEVLCGPSTPKLALIGTDGAGCLVGVDEAADVGLLERLHRLPGFDARALAVALEADPPHQATCWSRT